MFKKLIYIVSIFLFFSLLTSTTCNKDRQLFEIGDIEAHFTNISEYFTYNNSNPIKDDTVIMKLDIYPKYIVSKNSNFKLIKEANAFSPGLRTLNHSISKLNITCDQDFIDISVGDNINKYLLFLTEAYFSYYDSTWNYYDTLSIQDYVYSYLIQGSSENNLYNSIFMLKKRPQAGKFIFYFDFINSQGTHYKGKSDTLWLE